jgi:hypothetical protein
LLRREHSRSGCEERWCPRTTARRERIAGLLGGSVAVAKARLGLAGAGEAHLRITADEQALDGVQDPIYLHGK